MHLGSEVPRSRKLQGCRRGSAEPRNNLTKQLGYLKPGWQQKAQSLWVLAFIPELYPKGQLAVVCMVGRGHSPLIAELTDVRGSKFM